MNKKPTFYITTPIYYPSGDLHIGHAYTTTLAWALRNYKRLVGYETFFMTGADEHGQKIQLKANEAKLSPQAYVDLQSEKFKALWKLLEIDYDYYSRTTSARHKKAVVKQFSELYAQGIITKGEYVGWYSVSDEEFLTPLQAINREGKYYHPVSGAALVRVAEPSYIFHMSNYRDWLKTHIQTHPQFILPAKISHELMTNFIDKGLEDLSVSRSTFNWGIALNEDPSHVMYVWLDALNNYLTALGYHDEPRDYDYKKFWLEGTERVHVVGKEIARFHAIYWPIILHAAKVNLPTTVLAHGWLITPEGKMSKSKGNVVDPINLAQTYGAEALKYFFCSQIAIGNDGTFSEELLINTYNADLANTYGNLVSRTLALAKKHFSGPIVFNESLVGPRENTLRQAVSDHFTLYQQALDQFQVHVGLKSAIDLATLLNKYIEVTKPWALSNDLAQLALVLSHLLNGIYAVSLMLSIVLPHHAKAVINALNGPELDLKYINDWTKLNQAVPKQITSLFPRIKSE